MVKEKAGGLENQLKVISLVSGAAFATLTAEVGLSVKAFAESQAVSNKLSLALQNQGIYSKQLMESYKAQADELQRLTGIDDDAIKSGQAMLQGMIGQTAITKEMTQAALDLSTQTGSVSSAFEVIGRAVQGNTRGLKQFGITIDENLSKQERTAKVLEIVNQKFGGQAEEANKALGGIKGLERAFDDIQKKIGEEFAPIIETAIKRLTEFGYAIAEDQKLLKFTAALIGAGVAGTGLVTILGALGLAFTAISPIIATFGITMAAAFGPIGLIAAAIVAAGGALGYFAVQSHDAGAKASDLKDQIRETRDAITQLEKAASNPIKSVFSAQAQEDLDQARLKLALMEEELRKLNSLQAHPTETAQDKNKKKLADQAAKDEKDRQAREQEALEAHNQLITLETAHASQELIALKKEEADTLDKRASDRYKKSLGALKVHLDEVKTLEASQEATDLQRDKEFNDQLLANNKKYQALDDKGKAEFRLKNQAALKSQIQTEKTTRENALRAQLTRQIEANNQFLADQQKFGTTYAEINKTLHSEQVDGARQMFGTLSELQQSGNEELKAIGKAAALANIAIRTADGAMAAYAGAVEFFGPIIGTPIGIAAAAAMVAYGAEQVANVTAAADGGLITGGILGRDSVPALLMPGELVVPTRNYNEVVNAVAEQRLAQSGASAAASGSSGGGTEGFAHLIVEMKGNFWKEAEVNLVRRKALGISVRKS